MADDKRMPIAYISNFTIAEDGGDEDLKKVKTSYDITSLQLVFIGHSFILGVSDFVG